ncbi:type II secretion system protein GspL [Pseudomonas sp. HS6]|uniref:type II secretion system protein GspL n=1 Tax=Pseudomonas sp. HS6 TaxID=2850559 RepID=UPI00201950F3|nr:type II secretion system protein GspL [Pseudomonas sp. HS6]UQS14805.1 type II secretion system protein GspL [Pseudomonas sp. HS6]
MNHVRVNLPPLAELDLDSELDCAWLDRHGKITREDRQLLRKLPKQPLVCFLHPTDSLLASINLPPLTTSKTAAAVQCAAQALMLSDISSMHVAHGPRDASGQVQLAWLPRRDLQYLGQLLHQVGLNLKGLYPAAYSLPVMSGGVGRLYGDHLLLRQGPDSAQVQPLIDEAWLMEIALPAHWIGEGGPDAVQSTLADSQRWSGPLPGWGLHAGIQQPGTEPRGWGRALGLGALALAVWVIGLNLYAAREAGAGQQIKAQMAQRVKQAFPELPVILNPLQQARQQIAARQQGAADAPGQDFTWLVLQAGSGMPSMAGTVQRLAFVDEELRLSLLPEARRSGNDKDWQGTLAQAGISVTSDDDGWILRPAGEVAANDNDNDDSSGAEDE